MKVEKGKLHKEIISFLKLFEVALPNIFYFLKYQFTLRNFKIDR